MTKKKIFIALLVSILAVALCIFYRHYQIQKIGLEGTVNHGAPINPGMPPSQYGMQLNDAISTFLSQLKTKHPGWEFEVCEKCTEVKLVGSKKISVPIFLPGSGPIPVEHYAPEIEAIINASTTVSTLHPMYPTDLSNDANLLGASHNVFLGKVIAQTGNKETQIGPRTQYSVQVLDNIKGELKDTVTVDMLGGYQNGQLVAIEDVPTDDFLLQTRATYLFATRYNPDENWYTIIGHPNGKKMITKDDAKKDAELKSLGKSDPKYKAWEKAYAEEIPVHADVANDNARNSFQSLSPQTKAAAQSRANAAKQELEAAGAGQPTQQ